MDLSTNQSIISLYEPFPGPSEDGATESEFCINDHKPIKAVSSQNHNDAIKVFRLGESGETSSVGEKGGGG